MECNEDVQTDDISMETVTPKMFTFSEPEIIPSSPTNVGTQFDHGFEHAFNIPQQDIFTFAVPDAASQSSIQDDSLLHTDISDKQYKPKISRNTYKPSVNVFAQALKGTTMFEELKKNSRSHTVKTSAENALTCTHVPKVLLVKTTAKKYFTAFGNIVKMAIHPKKQRILVLYENKEEANRAYEHSGEYLGESFNVEWTKLHATPKSSTKKKDLHKNIVSNFLKTDEDEIKSEVASMMGLAYNLHDQPQNAAESIALPKRVKSPHPKSSKAASRAVEKMTAKSEKLKTESQISDLLPNTSIEELQSIIEQSASSSEDKYKVLEARDRLMRLKQFKSHNLATAKVTTGTCPDMCPEKERLMREATRQVALYEQIEGEYGINHAIAVKQYSRSSADQEEPMPHELRPVRSLKMTMSYLLHEIVTLCDQPGTNLGEWYHFLWDRTRGIRKDITQQELCCLDSVELVEQCARFHIVCSERLCAEDLSVFDNKINSDNLTKCLQSLKYMYHDLRVKGISCKNEPEFRAYIILLNLNSGNFMWELKRLPKLVQKSREVQFALAVHAALESNNYYKFFKLVRTTTYLNACILLSYFNQVRLKAFSVMVKAYCRTASTAYPLYELIDILGFEDENEATSFCEQVGLNASKDELHVLLNRQNYSMPVLNVKQNRACHLIESKRTLQQLSIAQCIAGGQMPDKTYKHHKPHNSFDTQNYLTPESVNASDQCSISTGLFTADDDALQVQPPEKDQSKTTAISIMQPTVFKTPTISECVTSTVVTNKSDKSPSFVTASMEDVAENADAKSAAIKTTTEKPLDIKNTVFYSRSQDNEFTATKKHESFVLGSVFSTSTMASNQSNLFAKPIETSLKNDVPSAFAMTTNKSIFSGSSQRNIFATKISTPTIFGNTSSNVQATSKLATPTSLPEVTKSKDVKSFASQKESAQKKAAEMAKVEELERKKQMQQINQSAEEIYRNLETEVVEECCADIVEDGLKNIRERNALSEEIARDVLNDVTSEIIISVLNDQLANERELQEISTRAKNRMILRYLNKWRRNTWRKKQQRRALENTPVWLQKHSVEECAKLLYSKEQNLVIQNMRERAYKRDVPESPLDSLAPIEFVIYAGIKENLKSLDTDTCPNYYWKLVISWPDLMNKVILWHHKKIMNQYLCPENYTTDPIIKIYTPNQFETLHVCIRHFEGLISDHHLAGSDALLFIAAASEDAKFVIKRLIETVTRRHKLMPIPLVFLVLGDGNLENQSKEIMSKLEDLLEAGYLSEYTIMFKQKLNEKAILRLTQSTILWLTVNRSPPNPLEMDYLEDVFDICLTEELWLRILDDASLNSKLYSALREPSFIINLHNEAVTHLMDIILDPEIFMYTKFSPELKNFLENRYTMPCSYEFFDDNIWKGDDYRAEVEVVMSNFTLPQWRYPWPVNEPDRLGEYIMQYCKEALSNVDRCAIYSNILSNLFFASSTSTVSNFVDILLCIVKTKIRLLGEDLKVIYNRNHIKHFRTLPWWFKSNVLMEYRTFLRERRAEEYGKENNGQGEPNAKRKKLQMLSQNQESGSEFTDSLDELRPLAEFCENTRTQVIDVHHSSKKIEDLLESQRHQNSLFEEELREALLDSVHDVV